MAALCRLCAQNRPLEKMTEIADPLLNIEQKLIDCCRWTQIKCLDSNAELPNKICIKCIEKLEQSWLFADSVKNAQYTLIDVINAEKIDSKPWRIPEGIGESYTIDENIAFFLEPFIQCDFKMDIKEDQLMDFQRNDANQVEHESNESDEAGCGINIEHNVPKPKKKKDPTKKSTKNVVNESSGKKIWKNKGMRTKVPDNFLQLVGNENCNDDGSINSDIIQRLGLPNWMILQHQCHICNAGFPSHYNLKKHFESEHSEQKLRYLCTICETTLRWARWLRNHIIKRHHPHLKYCCRKCNQYFWDVKKLKKHILTHAAKRDMVVLCEECGKAFDSDTSLRVYALSHIPAELRPIFECYACKRSFTGKQSLRHHYANHVGKRKRYACNMCDKDFARMDSLSRHQKIHLDVFSFVCIHCGKKFRSNISFKEHMNVHTGNKPYGCPICEYRTANSSNVHKHIKQTHGMPPGHGLRVVHFHKNN